jgi:hypothetical protein
MSEDCKEDLKQETLKQETLKQEDFMTEDICICCDEWKLVNESTLCINCAPFTHVCELCEETKHMTATFSPNQDGKVHCKDCASCKYCKMEKTGQGWNLECFNPECVFKCPGCDDMKPTREKNTIGGLYEHVCKDCSRCERCGNQMWDYICRCMV